MDYWKSFNRLSGSSHRLSESSRLKIAGQVSDMFTLYFSYHRIEVQRISKNAKNSTCYGNKVCEAYLLQLVSWNVRVRNQNHSTHKLKE